MILNTITTHLYIVHIHLNTIPFICYLRRYPIESICQTCKVEKQISILTCVTFNFIVRLLCIAPYLRCSLFYGFHIVVTLQGIFNQYATSSVRIWDPSPPLLRKTAFSLAKLRAVQSTAGWAPERG